MKRFNTEIAVGLFIIIGVAAVALPGRQSGGLMLETIPAIH